MKIKIYKKVIFTLLISILPIEVSAARLFFETKSTEVGVGQKLEISLYIDSESETINAVEGVVIIPSSIFAGTVRDGDSLISLWSERPTIDGQQITFGGLIPGGWRGIKGKIFSFIIETKEGGINNIFLKNVTTLLHDGKGTETATNTKPLVLSSDTSVLVTPFSLDIDDTESPESFSLMLAQDIDIFEKDYFIVFVAQDKGSGIDYYEVQETKNLLEDEQGGSWQLAESPYRIIDQSLDSFIYIKAIDRAGNIRISLLEPTKVPRRKIDIIIYLSLIILITITSIAIWYRQKKNKYE